MLSAVGERVSVPPAVNSPGQRVLKGLRDPDCGFPGPDMTVQPSVCILHSGKQRQVSAAAGNAASGFLARLCGMVT